MQRSAFCPVRLNVVSTVYSGRNPGETSARRGRDPRSSNIAKCIQSGPVWESLSDSRHSRGVIDSEIGRSEGANVAPPPRRKSHRKVV